MMKLKCKYLKKNRINRDEIKSVHTKGGKYEKNDQDNIGFN